MHERVSQRSTTGDVTVIISHRHNDILSNIECALFIWFDQFDSFHVFINDVTYFNICNRMPWNPCLTNMQLAHSPALSLTRSQIFCSTRPSHIYHSDRISVWKTSNNNAFSFSVCRSAVSPCRRSVFCSTFSITSMFIISFFPIYSHLNAANFMILIKSIFFSTFNIQFI